MMRNLVGAVTVVLSVVVASSCEGPNTSESNRGDLAIVPPGTTQPLRVADYDFGMVEVGTSEKVTFDLTNVGPDLARITAKKFEDAPVGVFFASAPSVVPPGETVDLTITFAPSKENEVYTGRFILEHDGDTVSVTVNLRGTGQPRP